MQQQQQSQVELGDQARQAGKEQVGHGRKIGHQMAPRQIQFGMGSKEVTQTQQADDPLGHECRLGRAYQSQPQPTDHDVVENDVQHCAPADQDHGQPGFAVVAQQIGHRQVAGQQQGTATNPVEVVTGLFPGLCALLDSQCQQDIDVPVVQQQGGQSAEQGQQPERIDQCLAGELEVLGPLLEGDGGGRAHADHGGETDQHHDDRVDQVDAGEAGGAHVVTDEDAIDQVVGTGNQHGHDGGEGIAPETAGHRPLAQCEVGRHICSLGEFDYRADSLN